MTRSNRRAPLLLAMVLSGQVAGCGHHAGTTSGGGGGNTTSATTTASATTTSTTKLTTGPITCGSSTCDGATQWCLRTHVQEAGSDTYACNPLPQPCAAMPTCDCVISHSMADSCVAFDFTACMDGAVKLCQTVP